MNPTHTYTAAGVYTVTLTITNAYASDTMTKTDYLRVGIAPIADFAANPMTGNLPLSGRLHRPVDRKPHHLVLGLR